MHSTNSDVRSRIEEAAFNPDLWTSAFHALFPPVRRSQTEVTFYRRPSGGVRKDAVRVRIGTDVTSFEAELIPVDDAMTGPPAIEFRVGDDVYGMRITSTGAAADAAYQLILELKDKIIYSIKVNCALLSKICFCGNSSLLEGIQDPIFKLTFDGVITWQNESAAAESWQEIYTSGAGNPLTLLQASEQEALQSALSELADNPNSSARRLHVTVPGQSPGATLALKIVRACSPSTSPWVELFKPAPQVLAVLRRSESKPNLSPSLLRKLYGFTAKEAQLAIALARGVSLKDYAESACVSFETARWHSKRIMRKMGCAKQQDVMYALLYRNALFSVLD